jgi:disulfide bond formation protein DsbB
MPMNAAASLAARPRAWLVAIVLVCVAALGAALVSQHVFDMQPCPWCVLQRLVFCVIALVALVAMPLVGGAGRLSPAGRGVLGLIAALALAGIGTALWQHFVAASSASCDLTLADRLMSGLGLDMALPEVFAPFASCADAKVNLLGMPYEFWSLALFALLAAAAWRVWRLAR